LKEKSPPVNKADILIVDDVPENLHLLNQLLSQTYKVRLAPNSKSSLAAARSRPPDLILLDIMMPDMDGFETAAQLKADPLTADIPIIFMSALDDAESKVKGFSVGGVDYISKPFQEVEVLARVKNHLAIRALYKQAQDEIIIHKQLEEKLQVSEEHYRLLAENISDVIWIFNLDQRRFTYISPSIEQLLGFTPEEAMAQTIEESLTPDSAHLVLDKLSSSLPRYKADPDKQQTLITEFQQPCKNGQVIWVEVSTLYRYNANHEIETIGVSRNIEQRKKSEAKLRLSEERHRMLADNSVDLIWTMTLKGQITYISPSIKNLFGYTPEEYLTLPLETLFAPDSWLIVQDGLVRAAIDVSGGRPIDFRAVELRHHCKDGSTIWVEITATGIYSYDGSFIEVLGITRDIRERKRMEEQLRISEQRHRLLADNAIELIITFDAHGRATYVSPSVEKLLGYTIPEVMEQSLDKILPHDNIAQADIDIKQMQTATEAGLPLENFRRDFVIARKDGSHVWAEVTATCMLNPEGQYVGILIVARDISERKRYEHALKKAHDAVADANELLHQIAVTDPLTGIHNRRFIQEIMGKEISEAQRYVQPLALILFDIDHFKLVNDQYGHKTGDIVLVELAKRVRMNLRATDHLARWGGEEFVVIATHCDRPDALALAEKLRSVVASLFFPEVGAVTASFGVAELQPNESPDSWFKRADDALYAAKDAGRNTVRYSAD
jgi:diguanylate cyclase (GGDEF)-like protein/PAS domain S-box-containing protein